MAGSDIKNIKDDVSTEPKFLAEKEYRERFREEQIKDLTHKILKFVIWSLFIIIGILFVIRIYHMAVPSGWKWLNESQLNGIDKFLYSGAFGGLLGRYTNKLFN